MGACRDAMRNAECRLLIAMQQRRFGFEHESIGNTEQASDSEAEYHDADGPRFHAEPKL